MKKELNMFFMVNGNKFPSESMPILMKSLENASEDKTKMLFALPLKKPIIGLILSFFWELLA